MTNHVSGKLSMSPGTHILTEDGKSIAQLNYGYDLPVQEANGRRLVACWNACEGMAIETLECMPYPFSKLLVQDFQDVVAQRDQLLAAAEFFKDVIDTLRETGKRKADLHSPHQWDKHVSAIAAVKAGAV